MSALLNQLEIYHASAPASELKHHTLELSHETFPGGAFRWVQGFDDMSFTLETGEVVEFEASGFGVSLPKRSLRGNQDLQFQLDNVTGEVLQALDGVIDTGGKVPVVYRVYMGSDSTVLAQPPISMTATAMTADYKSVKVIADFHDFVNKVWPIKRFTAEFAPGLKYF